jgi:hypothetical protein
MAFSGRANRDNMTIVARFGSQIVDSIWLSMFDRRGIASVFAKIANTMKRNLDDGVRAMRSYIVDIIRIDRVLIIHTS